MCPAFRGTQARAASMVMTVLYVVPGRAVLGFFNCPVRKRAGRGKGVRKVCMNFMKVASKLRSDVTQRGVVVRMGASPDGDDWLGTTREVMIGLDRGR